MRKIDFTVLMTTYLKDDSEQLKKSILSIYNNTIQPKDFVLIIDGQIGNKSHKIINEFKYSKGLKIYSLNKNSGLAVALNYGLEKIKTEWVARADADDVNTEDRFEKQINFIKENNNKIDLFGSAIKEFDDNNETLIRSTPTSEKDIKKFIKRRNPFNHMTVMFKLNKVLEVGGYPSLLKMQDYALWSKLLANKIKVKNMKDILVYVSGGKNLIKRRGGINYVISEIKLQYYLYSENLKTMNDAIFDGLIRSSIFILPFFIRKVIYRKILR